MHKCHLGQEPQGWLGGGKKSVGCGLPGQGKLVGIKLVTDLHEEGIQRKPFHELCNMGRERNSPNILFNYFGWWTFWYRDNFGLLKRHRNVSLYHRGIIDISDDWWKFKSKFFSDFPQDGIRPSWFVWFSASQGLVCHTFVNQQVIRDREKWTRDNLRQQYNVSSKTSQDVKAVNQHLSGL